MVHFDASGFWDPLRKENEPVLVVAYHFRPNLRHAPCSSFFFWFVLQCCSTDCWSVRVARHSRKPKWCSALFHFSFSSFSIRTPWILEHQDHPLKTPHGSRASLSKCISQQLPQALPARPGELVNRPLGATTWSTASWEVAPNVKTQKPSFFFPFTSCCKIFRKCFESKREGQKRPRSRVGAVGLFICNKKPPQALKKH